MRLKIEKFYKLPKIRIFLEYLYPVSSFCAPIGGIIIKKIGKTFIPYFRALKILVKKKQKRTNKFKLKNLKIWEKSFFIKSKFEMIANIIYFSSKFFIIIAIIETQKPLNNDILKNFFFGRFFQKFSIFNPNFFLIFDFFKPKIWAINRMLWNSLQMFYRNRTNKNEFIQKKAKKLLFFFFEGGVVVRHAISFTI